MTRLTVLFNGTETGTNDKPETFASILHRVSVAVQKEHEQKASEHQSKLGLQHMQMQPAIVGADQASFHYLLDPFNANTSLHAPSQVSYGTNQLSNTAPTDDTNSAIAANFAGLVSQTFQAMVRYPGNVTYLSVLPERVGRFIRDG